MVNSTRWLLAIALCLSSASGLFAGLIVDSFQTPLSIQNTGGSGGSAPATGVFGVNRTYSLQVFSGISQQLEINTGQLNLAVSPTVGFGDATLQLTYTDPTPSENLTTLGLNALLIEDVVTTGNWRVTVTLTDSANQTLVSNAIPMSSNADFLLELATLSPSYSTLGPLKEVGLFFSVAGATPQMNIGTISIVGVPEPATLALVGAGFLGASVMRRRWKSARQ